MADQGKVSSRSSRKTSVPPKGRISSSGRSKSVSHKEEDESPTQRHERIVKETLSLAKELKSTWNNGKLTNFNTCLDLLNRAKLSLTRMRFMPSTSRENLVRGELYIAREILETGAWVSLKVRDIPAFERYMSQLKCYYFDYKNCQPELPCSECKFELLGAYLLSLLCVNRISEFHTELELIQEKDPAAVDGKTGNKFINFVVDAEQNLMEGRFNKIFQLSHIPPSEAYKSFAEQLVKTSRELLSDCIEKSSEKIGKEKAAAYLHLDEKTLVAYAQRRNWHWDPAENAYTFKKEQVPGEIDSARVIRQSLAYIKDFERII